jgi:hypothetical protein
LSYPTILRIAAAQALGAAAAAYVAAPTGGQTAADPVGNVEFAPLIGAQPYFGKSWPTMSPAPGAGPMPPELLIYSFKESAETLALGGTAPQFDVTLTLVVDCRVETKTGAGVTAVLPAVPSADQITSTADARLEALMLAVKKALLTNIAFVKLLSGAHIKRIDCAQKYDERGQRILGNGAVALDLAYVETFEPAIATDLDLVATTINPAAGAVANEGNSGNGTIGPIGFAPEIQTGAYALLFTSATAFIVTAPDTTTAPGTLGMPFAELGLAFMVTAGGTPFIADDGFVITVQAMSTEVFLS